MGWGIVEDIATTPVKVVKTGGEALAGAGEAVWEGAKAGGEALAATTEAIASGVVDSVEDASTEVIQFGERFAGDPVGALESVTGDAWKTMVTAVELGTTQLAERALREAGLGRLADGIAYFVDVVDEVVEAVLRGIKCMPYLNTPIFAATVGALVGARAADLIPTKDEAYRWLKLGEAAKLIGEVPALEMLPCAIEAAFLVPIGSTSGAKLEPKAGLRARSALERGLAGSAVKTVGAGGFAAAVISLPPGVATVSRSPGKLDVMIIRGDGQAVAAAWEAGRDKEWRGWWPVSTGRALPGTPITAVSRSPDKLDVFMVGLDGRVWTAAWEPGDEGWRGWWPVLDLKVAPGTLVGAVSRAADKLDVFAVGNDGRPYTAAWEPGTDDWKGWWPVSTGRALPGTPITAVSRSPDKLDVFMVGLDGRVWTAAWEPGDEGWRGWWPIGSVMVLPKSLPACVVKSPGHLDVFIRSFDRAIYTAAWEAGRDKAWRGWWRIS